LKKRAKLEDEEFKKSPLSRANQGGYGGMPINYGNGAQLGGQHPQLMMMPHQGQAQPMPHPMPHQGQSQAIMVYMQPQTIPMPWQDPLNHFWS
jgi:hypothetical protein